MLLSSRFSRRKIFPKIYSSHVSFYSTYCTYSLISIGVYILYRITHIHAHTYRHVIIEGCEKSRDRGSLLACRSDLCFLQTRSAENAFPHSESIDLRVRFEIRYRSGICSRSCRARHLEEIYPCLRSVRAILRRGSRRLGENSTEKYARQR